MGACDGWSWLSTFPCITSHPKEGYYITISSKRFSVIDVYDSNFIDQNTMHFFDYSAMYKAV